MYEDLKNIKDLLLVNKFILKVAKTEFLLGPVYMKVGTPGRWGNLPNRGRKIARVYTQSYYPGMKFLEVVVALAIKEFKMSLRRRVVKRCRKNVI